jgi:hypothetical protein
VGAALGGVAGAAASVVVGPDLDGGELDPRPQAARMEAHTMQMRIEDRRMTTSYTPSAGAAEGLVPRTPMM